ncbi:hypothetical protein [Aestuariivirga sp.]|uniref:hypothetical protein n=1 Tax=Aestuariivirga sp. TaxID=2650926 RepID=UPI00391C3E9A
MVDDLLEIARHLANANPNGKPKQAYLKRAVSTAYYALFHAMARATADVMLGSAKKNRPDRAWVQLYRGLDHGTAKSACEAARNIGFPNPIKECADAFVELQKARHDADYDPSYRLSRAEVIALIDKSESAIKKLRAAPPLDRAAFGVQLVIKKR